MSRLVLTHSAHRIDGPVTRRFMRSFEIAVCAPGDDVVIALMRGDEPENVSYIDQAGKLDDAIRAAIRIAARHDYVIDDVLIVGWRL